MPRLIYRAGRIAFCLTLLIVFIISGCGRKKAADLNKQAVSESKTKEALAPGKSDREEILAKVGDDIITITAYKQEFAMLPPAYRNIAMQDKSKFLENIINKRLLLNEAKRKNLEDSENVKKLYEKMKEEIVIQELIDKEVGDKTLVTDAEIEEYYRNNQNKFMEPAKIKACHILVDSELLAKKVLADLESGADFAELAKEYSLDTPTKDKGGDIGYFAKGTLIAPFEEACEKLNVGEISDVIKTDLGYHIIKVLDKKEAAAKTLEEVREQIKNELVLNKEMALYDSLLQQLRKNQNISINTQLLENIDFSQTN